MIDLNKLYRTVRNRHSKRDHNLMLHVKRLRPTVPHFTSPPPPPRTATTRPLVGRLVRLEDELLRLRSPLGRAHRDAGAILLLLLVIGAA